MKVKRNENKGRLMSSLETCLIVALFVFGFYLSNSYYSVHREIGFNDSGSTASPIAADSVPAKSVPAKPAAVKKSGKNSCSASSYHFLLTAQSSTYLNWQSLITYYHYKKQKGSTKCNDIGGFTRLIAGSMSSDKISTTVPTVFVPAIDTETMHHRYKDYNVLNRPYSMMEFLEGNMFDTIEEDFIFLAETDHILMKPMKNLAKKGEPVAYQFSYMNPNPSFETFVSKFCSDVISTEDVQPIGPSPIIIHKDDLKKVIDEWLRISISLKLDPEADAQLGWVLEMWGFAIASACRGLKYKILPNFLVEPSSAVVVKDLSKYEIFHFTYGIEYKLNGDPVIGDIGEWSLDKRHYAVSYPPKNLHAPPAKAHIGAKFLVKAWNEAMNSYPDWEESPVSLGTYGWVNKAISSQDIKRYKLDVFVDTTWTWVLESDQNAGAVPIFTLQNEGTLKTIWDTGTWSIAKRPPPHSSSIKWSCGKKKGDTLLRLNFGSHLHYVCFNLKNGTLHSIRVPDGELNKGVRHQGTI